MTERKIRIDGYFGQRTEKPMKFIPRGIFLKLLLHKEDGFKIEHDMIVDDETVKQFIHYNKPQHGCGSFAGIMELI